MGRPDIRGVDLAMLRTFDALLRERSVSRAASRLFLSQPAVSASLKRLRETFDDPLFTRTAHGVVPTPRALALAPRVEAVLQDMQQLLNAAPEPAVKEDVSARYAEATALLESGQFVDAVEQFRAVLQLAPESVQARNNLGVALASLGRLDEAVEQFQQALTLDPTFEDARRNLALARAKRPQTSAPQQR